MPPEIHVTPSRPNRARQVTKVAAGLALAGMVVDSVAYLRHDHHETDSPAPAQLTTRPHQEITAAAMRDVTQAQTGPHHIATDPSLTTRAHYDRQLH